MFEWEKDLASTIESTRKSVRNMSYKFQRSQTLPDQNNPIQPSPVPCVYPNMYSTYLNGPRSERVSEKYEPYCLPDPPSFSSRARSVSSRNEDDFIRMVEHKVRKNVERLLDDKLRILNRSFDTLRKQSESFENDLNRVHRTIGGLKHNITSSETEINGINNELASKRAVLHKLNSMTTEEEAWRNLIESDIFKLKKQIAHMQKQIDREVDTNNHQIYDRAVSSHPRVVEMEREINDIRRCVESIRNDKLSSSKYLSDVENTKKHIILSLEGKLQSFESKLDACLKSNMKKETQSKIESILPNELTRFFCSEQGSDKNKNLRKITDALRKMILPSEKVYFLKSLEEALDYWLFDEKAPMKSSEVPDIKSNEGNSMSSNNIEYKTFNSIENVCPRQHEKEEYEGIQNNIVNTSKTSLRLVGIEHSKSHLLQTKINEKLEILLQNVHIKSMVQQRFLQIFDGKELDFTNQFVSKLEGNKNFIQALQRHLENRRKRENSENKKLVNLQIEEHIKTNLKLIQQNICDRDQEMKQFISYSLSRMNDAWSLEIQNLHEKLGLNQSLSKSLTTGLELVHSIGNRMDEVEKKISSSREYIELAKKFQSNLNEAFTLCRANGSNILSFEEEIRALNIKINHTTEQAVSGNLEIKTMLQNAKIGQMSQENLTKQQINEITNNVLVDTKRRIKELESLATNMDTRLTSQGIHLRQDMKNEITTLELSIENMKPYFASQHSELCQTIKENQRKVDDELREKEEKFALCEISEVQSDMKSEIQKIRHKCIESEENTDMMMNQISEIGVALSLLSSTIVKSKHVLDQLYSNPPSYQEYVELNKEESIEDALITLRKYDEDFSALLLKAEKIKLNLSAINFRTEKNSSKMVELKSALQNQLIEVKLGMLSLQEGIETGNNNFECCNSILNTFREDYHLTKKHVADCENDLKLNKSKLERVDESFKLMEEDLRFQRAKIIVPIEDKQLKLELDMIKVMKYMENGNGVSKEITNVLGGQFDACTVSQQIERINENNRLFAQEVNEKILEMRNFQRRLDDYDSQLLKISSSPCDKEFAKFNLQESITKELKKHLSRIELDDKRIKKQEQLYSCLNSKVENLSNFMNIRFDEIQPVVFNSQSILNQRMIDAKDENEDLKLQTVYDRLKELEQVNRSMESKLTVLNENHCRVVSYISKVKIKMQDFRENKGFQLSKPIYIVEESQNNVEYGNIRNTNLCVSPTIPKPSIRNGDQISLLSKTFVKACLGRSQSEYIMCLTNKESLSKITFLKINSEADQSKFEGNENYKDNKVLAKRLHTQGQIPGGRSTVVSDDINQRRCLDPFDSKIKAIVVEEKNECKTSRNNMHDFDELDDITETYFTLSGNEVEEYCIRGGIKNRMGANNMQSIMNCPSNTPFSENFAGREVNRNSMGSKLSSHNEIYGSSSSLNSDDFGVEKIEEKQISERDNTINSSSSQNLTSVQIGEESIKDDNIKLESYVTQDNSDGLVSMSGVSVINEQKENKNLVNLSNTCESERASEQTIKTNEIVYPHIENLNHEKNKNQSHPIHQDSWKEEENKDILLNRKIKNVQGNMAHGKTVATSNIDIRDDDNYEYSQKDSPVLQNQSMPEFEMQIEDASKVVSSFDSNSSEELNKINDKQNMFTKQTHNNDSLEKNRQKKSLLNDVKNETSELSRGTPCKTLSTFKSIESIDKTEDMNSVEDSMMCLESGESEKSLYSYDEIYDTSSLMSQENLELEYFDESLKHEFDRPISCDAREKSAEDKNVAHSHHSQETSKNDLFESGYDLDSFASVGNEEDFSITNISQNRHSLIKKKKLELSIKPSESICTEYSFEEDTISTGSNSISIE